MVEHHKHRQNKRLSQVLPEEVATFWNLLQASGGLVIVVDASGTMQQVSAAAEMMTGYTPSELVGQSIDRLVIPAWRQRVHETYQQQLDGASGPIQIELPVRTRSGAEHWFEQWLVAGPDGSIYTLNRDITETKNFLEERDAYVEALEQERHRLHTVIDNIPDHIHVRDGDGQFLLVNQAYARHLGVDDPQEMQGKRLGDYFDPEHTARFEEEDDYIRKSGESIYKDQEADALSEDSSEVGWYSLTKSPLKDSHGHVSGFVTIVRDITDLKRKEADLREQTELYRTLARNLPNIVVYLYDQDLNFLIAEGETMKRVGFTQDMIEGKNLREVVPKTSYPRLEKLYRSALDGENSHFESIYQQRVFSTHAVPVRNEHGEIFAGLIVSQDITERKQTENELRESEERFRNMADTAPVLIWMAGLDKGCHYFNQRWLDFTGRSLEEEFGFGWMEGIHPDDYDRCLSIYENAFDQRIEFRMEYRLRRQDGHYCWILDHGTPRFLPDGTFTGYIGTCIDIDDRKQAEEALESSERRNRAMLQALPDMIFVLDQDGVFVDFHSAKESDLAMPADYIKGTNIRNSPLPEPVVDNALYYAEQALEKGIPQSFEYQMELRGHENAYEARIAPLNNDQVLIVVRNMSDLKRVEEELSRHIEDLTMLYEIESKLTNQLDIDYVLQMALDSAMRLSSAEAGFIALLHGDKLSAERVIGNYEAARLDTVLKKPDSLVRQVLKEEKERMALDVSTVKGYYPVIPETVAKIVLPLGGQEGVIGIINLETSKPDVFDHDAFEFLRLATGRISVALDNSRLYRRTQQQVDELQRLYNQIQRLEQLKTDMIRIASHDLRNPLATILGYIEMLRWDLETHLSEDQLNQLRLIEESARRMQKIISDILSLERIEEAAQESMREHFDLVELVENIYAENLALSGRKGQSLTLDLAESPVIVDADPVQLHEAITNLIGNAIKYTPDEGKVHVSLHTEQGQAMLRVIDNGYGIPEKYQKRLFQPFYRVKSKETRKIEGTGLGLHLVKNIVERQDGKIFVESTYKEGSTFGFDLPLAEEDGQA